MSIEEKHIKNIFLLLKESGKLKEGTWAFNKEKASVLKTNLETLLRYPTSKVFYIDSLLSKYEKKFFNTVGDDILWDFISSAKNNLQNKRIQYQADLRNAIERISDLSRFNLAEVFKPILKEFIDFSNPEQVEKEKKHYNYIKDLEAVRGQYRPTIKTEGMSTTEGIRTFGLYLQDEASAIMIDKYGFEKGYKLWVNSIDYGGAMYQTGSKIANEKLKMCRELNIKLNSYWERSYLDIWKEWSSKVKNKNKII